MTTQISNMNRKDSPPTGTITSNGNDINSTNAINSTVPTIPTTSTNPAPAAGPAYNYNSDYIPRTTFPPAATGDHLLSPRKKSVSPPVITKKATSKSSKSTSKSTSAVEDDSDEESRLLLQRLKQHKVKTHQTLLSTQSPEGIAAASLITPNRLAQLLIQTGPLPIRHITKHLSQQIPDFALLSLSKQRRLIMAALEMGDEATGCVFEKVGWGQWATKKISSLELLEYNQTKLKQQLEQQDKQQDSLSPRRQSSISSSPPVRRQSITNQLNDPHSLKLPYNPASLDELVIESSSSLNTSDSDQDEDLEDVFGDDEELFKLENNSLTNVRFSSRVLNSLNLQQQLQTPQLQHQSPQRRSFSLTQGQPQGQQQSQRRGSSSHGIRKPRQQQLKSRLNSFDYYELKFDGQSIDGVLDLALVPESIMIRKKPRSSFSESYLRSTPTPSLKISSEENLPLSSSSPPPPSDLKMESESQVQQPDTDEEDWQSIGADKLSAAYTLLMINKKD